MFNWTAMHHSSTPQLQQCRTLILSQLLFFISYLNQQRYLKRKLKGARGQVWMQRETQLLITIPDSPKVVASPAISWCLLMPLPLLQEWQLGRSEKIFLTLIITNLLSPTLQASISRHQRFSGLNLLSLIAIILRRTALVRPRQESP